VLRDLRLRLQPAARLHRAAVLRPRRLPGRGLANGTYVLLEVVGMFELDQVVARVANQTTNTFELEGVDTTTYNTFVSGTAEAITFGSSMSTAQGVNVSGGEPEFVDITTVHDNVRKRAPTVVSPMTMSIESFYDPSNAALAQLALATRTKSTRAILLTFANSTKMVGSAYVAAAGVPTGTAQDIVKTPVSLEFQGLPTVYTT
jgi:Phage tail tube protein, TTP